MIPENLCKHPFLKQNVKFWGCKNTYLVQYAVNPEEETLISGGVIIEPTGREIWENRLNSLMYSSLSLSRTHFEISITLTDCLDPQQYYPYVHVFTPDISNFGLSQTNFSGPKRLDITRVDSICTYIWYNPSILNGIRRLECLLENLFELFTSDQLDCHMLFAILKK